MTEIIVAVLISIFRWREHICTSAAHALLAFLASDSHREMHGSFSRVYITRRVSFVRRGNK